ARGRKATAVFDCDIHHNYPKIDVLFPYLPRKYVDQIKLWGPSFGGGPGSLNGGVKGRRADSFPPEGGPAGSSLDFMIKQHLDTNNVRYGVLTGEFIPVNFISDPYYLAAMCSA